MTKTPTLPPGLVRVALASVGMRAVPVTAEGRGGSDIPPESESDLAALFPDPLVVVDRRVAVMSANGPALALLPGLRLRQPLAMALRAPQVLDSVATAIAAGQPADTTFGGLLPSDPTFAVRIRPFRPERPDGSAAALFFRDLTAERRLETMRVDFVANASHELRTPLASVLGFIETLQGPARDDAAARDRFLEIMRVQASRMARLIDDLLRLSRVEMHAHQPPSTPLDLVPVMGHIVEVMTPLATERDVVLVLEPAIDRAVVLGDRDEIIRVAENLLENAIKYGGSGGRVEVGLSRQDGLAGRAQIVLSVRDHGPGIPAEHLPRLTERFYRVDAGESRREGGTGLGLAIVKHIVGRHRGRLAIESTPGVGTTCIVTIPEVPQGTVT